jgi:hypothetical protein
MGNNDDVQAYREEPEIHSFTPGCPVCGCCEFYCLEPSIAEDFMGPAEDRYDYTTVWATPIVCINCGYSDTLYDTE